MHAQQTIDAAKMRWINPERDVVMRFIDRSRINGFLVREIMVRL
jgi:hypothetical protein